MTDAGPTRSPTWWRWLVLLVAASGLVVVAWVCITQWGGVVHGHPAYPVLLVVTVVGSLVAAWRARRPRGRRTGRRRAAGVVLVVLGVGWLGAIAWLRPLSAVEPAVSAMATATAVRVTESPTSIVMAPANASNGTGVFFQPGALVDPRAYAAVLRPLADDGHTVVITKPPLGIALLNIAAFDATRAAHPQVTRWVLGGHSLGGVVAAMQADAADEDATAPAAGLVLYASYPARDISDSLTAAVLSISGSRDGLSTPERIAASRTDLPADAEFTVVDGAVHAYFGDYGPQPGDGIATISHDDARDQIARATVDFVRRVTG